MVSPHPSGKTSLASTAPPAMLGTRPPLRGHRRAQGAAPATPAAAWGAAEFRVKDLTFFGIVWGFFHGISWDLDWF